MDGGEGHELRLSNLNKVFWPDEGYTKGDLIAFYFNVADHPAVPARAAAHHEADAERREGELLLREGRAVAHAGLDVALRRPDLG